MLTELKLSMRKGSYGAGIYDAGDSEKCYTRLFVTDTQRVLPINYHVISEDDLLEVYRWGWEDSHASLGKPLFTDDDDTSGEV